MPFPVNSLQYSGKHWESKRSTYAMIVFPNVVPSPLLTAADPAGPKHKEDQ
jgi:hypothetical protein